VLKHDRRALEASVQLSDARDGQRKSVVLEGLAEKSPKLVAMYKTALATLQAPPIEGCESGRVSVFCHCVREIMTGLPSAMSDGVIPRPIPSSSSLVSKLPNHLAKHPDLDLSLDQDVIPVPKRVAEAFDALVEAATKEAGRNRHNTAALITGGTDTKHPAIKQWMGAYEFFVGWTHLDRFHDQDRTLPSDEELIARLRVVEDVIEVRTNAFFENVRSVEDLLAEINVMSESDS
jgi:hypothetical protein